MKRVSRKMTPRKEFRLQIPPILRSAFFSEPLRRLLQNLFRNLPQRRIRANSSVEDGALFFPAAPVVKSVFRCGAGAKSRLCRILKILGVSISVVDCADCWCGLTIN